ncbi:hypothetical protein GCM10010178_78300 [Lentzea flava]|uniref:Uncharacterized protein n=1 Tax=Lentzea flava TaxID=103732 RepID=A0ABQ2VAH0_9PSEU|nr:hypothetical protein GCM10010178_78300 [Lentzea flava]
MDWLRTVCADTDDGEEAGESGEAMTAPVTPPNNPATSAAAVSIGAVRRQNFGAGATAGCGSTSDPLIAGKLCSVMAPRWTAIM